MLDFGAVDRLPDGLPPLFGRLLWLVHTDGDIADVEADLREHGFLRPGVSVDMEALRTFLAPLADPSRHESFKFSREWMRGEAARVTDLRGASVGQAAQPAAVLHPHPPGLDGRHRRAVPARGCRASSAPRCCAGCPATAPTT